MINITKGSILTYSEEPFFGRGLRYTYKGSFEIEGTKLFTIGTGKFDYNVSEEVLLKNLIIVEESK